jgi:hypothetical protein
MDLSWDRIVQDLMGRVSGPMHLRLYLNPLMAVIFGVRDGFKDGRDGAPPYFWAIFSEPGNRWHLLKNGFVGVSRVLISALVVDAIYQLIELKRLYPGEAILVALILAFLPYLLIRGPANRLARWRDEHRAAAPIAKNIR